MPHRNRQYESSCQYRRCRRTPRGFHSFSPRVRFAGPFSRRCAVRSYHISPFRFRKEMRPAQRILPEIPAGRTAAVQPVRRTAAGGKRRSAASGGCSEALSRIRQKQRADKPAVFIAVTVDKRRSTACGGCGEALSRIRQKQRAGWPAVFIAVTVDKRRSAASGGAVETACFPPGAVIYSTRRCTTAGGWLHHPKGGAVYAYHITYRTVYRNDHCEKQKPPPGRVTVSF